MSCICAFNGCTQPGHNRMHLHMGMLVLVTDKQVKGDKFRQSAK